MSVLSVNAISKHFAGKQIIKSLSFDLEKGENIALVGRSGEGKSSLLKIIAGLLDADEGEVLFNGKYVAGPANRLVPGHPEIKLVNQDFALDIYHTVEENIRLKILHHPKHIIDEITDELIEVMGLSRVCNQKAGLLSGGEQQRLALARTLACEPEVLLLDEPFVHLDPITRRRVEGYIQTKCKEWNSSVILVTHDGQEAMAWANRILFINKGNVCRTDSAEGFYNHPASYEEAQFFGVINRVVVEGKERLFRPNAFSITTKKGLTVKIVNSSFLGSHYVVKVRTFDEQELILFSANNLNQTITIQPYYV
jgi:iron(III) transport system ATP-binding protein